ncbi:hypothetical protein HY639_05090 [Candidatus Woesearchaeota archaeon]|nr:hypothetical protein [Candidatus Woesearchaeota archaeon]
MLSKEFLNKVKDFGLNSYEAKIWAAILSRGISTASELSDISNVPRSRAYDVLESLEKKGFIIMKLGKPIKYIAVPPEEVIHRVKKRIGEEAEQRVKLVESIERSDVLDELKLLHQGIQHIDPTELSSAIKGQENIYNHLSSMIKGAKQSVTLVTNEEGLRRKAEALRHSFEIAQRRGVKIEIFAPFTEKNKKAVEALKNLAMLKSVPFHSRFCIVDNESLLFMLVEDIHAAYDTAVFVKSPYFAGTVKSLFDASLK